MKHVANPSFKRRARGGFAFFCTPLTSNVGRHTELARCIVTLFSAPPWRSSKPLLRGSSQVRPRPSSRTCKGIEAG
jgi:hypothetical protein